MEKSFNDQELSDIMKEIEALEEDFTASEERSGGPVMEELAHMEESESIPVGTSTEEDEEEAVEDAEVEEVKFEAPAPTRNVVTLGAKKAEPESTPVTTGKTATSMSFKIQGNLSLELQFDIGGKVVCLEVTETGLSIEMEGGMKFTVPVTETTTFKKAI